MSAEGSHLGWRSGSLDTILKIDHLRTIHAMFALNWNETKSTKTKRNQQKRKETKRNQRNENETNENKTK